MKQSGIGRIHWGLTGLLLLVWWDIQVVFELSYPGLGFFAFFAAAFFTWKLGLALLKQVKKKVCISEAHT